MSEKAIKFCEVPMVVEFDYHAEEKESSCHPYYPETVDLTGVKVGGVEIIELLSGQTMDSIEAAILDAIRQDRAEQRMEHAMLHGEER